MDEKSHTKSFPSVVPLSKYTSEVEQAAEVDEEKEEEELVEAEGKRRGSGNHKIKQMKKRE